MGNLMQERGGVTHYAMPLVFQSSNVPDSAGNMGTVEPASNDYVMTHAGSIVGLSVRHNADLTGGTITWRPTIGGTADTTLTVVTDDTHQQAYASQAAEVVKFAAGDRLGIDWIKTGTVAPTTTDVTAILFVVLDDVDL